MFTPKKFKETDEHVLLQHICQYPLAALITCSNSVLDAEYIPFHVHEESGVTKLQGHIAKANKLWQDCSDGQQVLLLFQGPQGYISPNFYPSKQDAGKAVPTWNYAVVQVRGKIHFKHDKTWLLDLLSAFSDHQEAQQLTPWSVADAPASYIDKLIKAVVGVEIKVEQITGKFKLSQNKSESDHRGVVLGLQNSSELSDKSLAKRMMK